MLAGPLTCKGLGALRDLSVEHLLPAFQQQSVAIYRARCLASLPGGVVGQHVVACAQSSVAGEGPEHAAAAAAEA